MSEHRLNGKLCVVTGAAAGIGRETVLAFAEAGAKVHAVDRDSGGLGKLAAEVPSIATHAFDITDAQAVAEFHAELPRLDVQFNCAGIVTVGGLGDCSKEDWEQALSVNVTSIFLMMQAALPRLQSGGGGSIINMASVISSIGAAPQRFAYGATKAAVLGMTKSVALDYASVGIRCNAICPSGVETPSMTDRIEAMEDPDAARAMFSSRQPVGRMGTPAEIAELALYLASDASVYMTGSHIVIDGGAKL
ncbi:SDR family oxidoreductase [Paracoccus saliphilus]|uniref:2-dehydro-3-deoxy-L-fuconate dehydrogenase n=1 Tax=Paracoccus saliphilus TaxID=405559 RepID=A0AA45W528_9RHOB|nr:SDR family oxidoreductase [Paracoccus saliphilus]WCR02125.1 SDR family oxidoreductase [Paracoccus saliphilus]SIS90276.1 2-dehydro-3-deoxy-L-fuconate dehydrogenase [Paracoccus saliphilus]